MTDERVQEFYDQLRFYYLKKDSDWSDKAKCIRTVAHDFYNEITRSYGTFAEALKEFYKWNKYTEVSNAAFALKDQLNEVVHHNKQIDEETFILYYSMLVRLIYLATNVLPDQATLAFIGYKSSEELAGLNDEQIDAVLCDAQIIYVSAGPGTGKTHLLINKLLHYINVSSKPEKIVALSYTNTAANELGEKFHKASFENGVTRPYEFYNGTLHSFCFKMLKTYYNKVGKEFNYIIIDETDIKELAEEFRIQFNDRYKKEEIEKCLKSRLRSTNPELQKLIAELKSRYNIISIDDILTTFIDQLNDYAFRDWFRDQVTVLVIDEAQDLTELNYRIFDLLLQLIPDLKVFLVGDSRQNIFGFNGGSYEHLDAFLKRHSNYTKKSLTGTYRCPQPVCDYVNSFTFLDCENTPLRSVGGNTGEVSVKGYESVDFEAARVISLVRQINDLNNTAVLCATLRYLETFIALLGSAGIPYRVFGGQKIVKPHIKLLNHLLRIIDSDNTYSITSIDRSFGMHLDRFPGRNNVERFYNTREGLILKDIKDDIRNKTEMGDEISLKAIVHTLVETFFSHKEQKVLEDLEALETITEQYHSIADFLLGFAIDREAFSRFIEKNYIECTVPITDKYLTVSTIHSAKGLEWKNVIIMGMSEGHFPNTWFDRDKSDAEKAKSLNESRKAMFVAATRTEGNLYLTYSMRGPKGHPSSPSRFLKGASR